MLQIYQKIVGNVAMVDALQIPRVRMRTSITEVPSAGDDALKQEEQSHSAPAS